MPKSSNVQTDADYITNLEGTICSLVNHSHLTVAFIEGMVSGSSKVRKRLTGGEDLYHIPSPDVGALLYGVYELDGKLGALKDAYYERSKAASAPMKDGENHAQ